LQINVNNIKVDFVKHDYNLLEGIKSEGGIKYLGKKDISAMKLMAIANRSDQAKDFVDVTESNWLAVRLLKGELSAEYIKLAIIDKMNNYNRIADVIPTG
jgi:hypothetical protein